MVICGTVDNPVRVAVVDDDENTRLCFKDILQSANHFRLVGSFSNATEALAGIPHLCPDLTLMDIGLPDLNGLECTRRLRQAMPHSKIIIVTGTHESNWVGASLQAGAIAYLIKPVIGNQLLATLRFAAINPGKKMADDLSATGPAGANLPLSPREKKILKELAEGLLYKEISEKLGISYTAVHKCLDHIYRKLKVSNRGEATRIWLDSTHN